LLGKFINVEFPPAFPVKTNPPPYISVEKFVDAVLVPVLPLPLLSVIVLPDPEYEAGSAKSQSKTNPDVGCPEIINLDDTVIPKPLEDPDPIVSISGI
jgi:hypothetical protein